MILCGYCKKTKSGMLIYRERYICPDCVLPKLERLDELEPFTASPIETETGES
jgi:hypothetical protein